MNVKKKKSFKRKSSNRIMSFSILGIMLVTFGLFGGKITNTFASTEDAVLSGVDSFDKVSETEYTLDVKVSENTLYEINTFGNDNVEEFMINNQVEDFKVNEKNEYSVYTDTDKKLEIDVKLKEPSELIKSLSDFYVIEVGELQEEVELDTVSDLSAKKGNIYTFVFDATGDTNISIDDSEHAISKGITYVDVMAQSNDINLDTANTDLEKINNAYLFNTDYNTIRMYDVANDGVENFVVEYNGQYGETTLENGDEEIILDQGANIVDFNEVDNKSEGDSDIEIKSIRRDIDNIVNVVAYEDGNETSQDNENDVDESKSSNDDGSQAEDFDAKSTDQQEVKNYSKKENIQLATKKEEVNFDETSSRILGVDRGDAPGYGTGEIQIMQGNPTQSQAEHNTVWLGYDAPDDDSMLTGLDDTTRGTYTTNVGTENLGNPGWLNDDETGFRNKKQNLNGDMEFFDYTNNIQLEVPYVLSPSVGSQAKVLVWIDFDGNGSFDEDEGASSIVSSYNYQFGYDITDSAYGIVQQSTPITFGSPGGEELFHTGVSNTYMRAVITTDLNTQLTDGNKDKYNGFGEVEDYPISIISSDVCTSSESDIIMKPERVSLYDGSNTVKFEGIQNKYGPGKLDIVVRSNVSRKSASEYSQKDERFFWCWFGCGSGVNESKIYYTSRPGQTPGFSALTTQGSQIVYNVYYHGTTTPVNVPLGVRFGDADSGESYSFLLPFDKVKYEDDATSPNGYTTITNASIGDYGWSITGAGSNPAGPNGAGRDWGSATGASYEMEHQGNIINVIDSLPTEDPVGYYMEFYWPTDYSGDCGGGSGGGGGGGTDTDNLTATKKVTDANNDGQIDNGEKITYTISVTNTGDKEVSNIKVKDDLNTQLAPYFNINYSQVVEVSPSAIAVTPTNATLQNLNDDGITISSLGAKQTVNLSFDMNAKNNITSLADKVVNKAIVDSENDHLEPSVEIPVVDPDVGGGGGDLEARKEASDASGDGIIDNGEEVTYTIVAKNTGTEEVDMLFGDDIEFQLKPYFDIDFSQNLIIEPSSLAVSPSNPTIQTLSDTKLNVYSVQPNQEVKVSFTVTAKNNISDLTDKARNIAVVGIDGKGLAPEVTLPVVDSDGGGGELDDVVSNKTAADASGDGIIDNGEKVTYTISVENKGTTAVNNITVTDYIDVLLDQYFEIDYTQDLVISPSTIDVTPSNPTLQDLNDGDLTITKLDPSEKVSITFEVTAKSNISDLTEKVINLAVVESGGDKQRPSIELPVVDPDGGGGELDDVVSKKDAIDENNDGEIDNGEKVTYTISVENKGTTAVNNITITDDIDTQLKPYFEIDYSQDLIVIPSTADVTPNNPTLQDLNDGDLTITKLDPSEKVSISFEVTAKSNISDLTSSVINLAVVESGGDKQEPSIELPVVDPDGGGSSGIIATKTAIDASGDGVIDNSEEVVYTIKVTNTGEKDYEGIIITDDIDTQLKPYFEIDYDQKLGITPSTMEVSPEDPTLQNLNDDGITVITLKSDESISVSFEVTAKDNITDLTDKVENEALINVPDVVKEILNPSVELPVGPDGGDGGGSGGGGSGGGGSGGGNGNGNNIVKTVTDKSAPFDILTPGEVVTYSISVKNLSQDDRIKVTLTDDIVNEIGEYFIIDNSTPVNVKISNSDSKVSPENPTVADLKPGFGNGIDITLAPSTSLKTSNAVFSFDLKAKNNIPTDGNLVENNACIKGDFSDCDSASIYTSNDNTSDNNGNGGNNGNNSNNSNNKNSYGNGPLTNTGRYLPLLLIITLILIGLIVIRTFRKKY